MKKIALLLLVVAFVSCQSGNKNTNNSEGKSVEVVEATVNISGMHCENCVASVEKGINALEGISEVKVSLTDSTAIVKYDVAKVELAEIENAIVKRGYKVK